MVKVKRGINCWGHGGQNASVQLQGTIQYWIAWLSSGSDRTLPNLFKSLKDVYHSERVSRTLLWNRGFKTDLLLKNITLPHVSTSDKCILFWRMGEVSFILKIFVDTRAFQFASPQTSSVKPFRWRSQKQDFKTQLQMRKLITITLSSFHFPK